MKVFHDQTSCLITPTINLTNRLYPSLSHPHKLYVSHPCPFLMCYYPLTQLSTGSPSCQNQKIIGGPISKPKPAQKVCLIKKIYVLLLHHKEGVMDSSTSIASQESFVVLAAQLTNLNCDEEPVVDLQDDRERIWSSFRYERFPVYCFFRGIRGHKQLNCKDMKSKETKRNKGNEKDNETPIHKQYGPWLKALTRDAEIKQQRAQFGGSNHNAQGNDWSGKREGTKSLDPNRSFTQKMNMADHCETDAHGGPLRAHAGDKQIRVERPSEPCLQEVGGGPMLPELDGPKNILEESTPPGFQAQLGRGHQRPRQQETQTEPNNQVGVFSNVFSNCQTKPNINYFSSTSEINLQPTQMETLPHHTQSGPNEGQQTTTHFNSNYSPSIIHHNTNPNTGQTNQNSNTSQHPTSNTTQQTIQPTTLATPQIFFPYTNDIPEHIHLTHTTIPQHTSATVIMDCFPNGGDMVNNTLGEHDMDGNQEAYEDGNCRRKRSFHSQNSIKVLAREVRTLPKKMKLPLSKTALKLPIEEDL